MAKTEGLINVYAYRNAVGDQKAQFKLDVWVVAGSEADKNMTDVLESLQADLAGTPEPKKETTSEDDGGRDNPERDAILGEAGPE